MPRHVIIDGNNLLHAMHAHAPVPTVGRETLVRIVERWARRGDDEVTIVFDGPPPQGGLLQQMASRRVTVRFSAPRSADDIIVALIHQARDPGTIRAITSDTAIRHEAHARRSACTGSVAFITELFDVHPTTGSAGTGSTDEKPLASNADETARWLKEFGIEIEEDPFDGGDAMEH